MAAAPAQGVPTQLSHVALRVRDVGRAVDFYTNVVGLQLRNRRENAAFLGASEEQSHELALFGLGDTAEGPDPKGVGMYHMAWQMASFADLEQFHERLLTHGAKIAGYSDTSCNVMFFDPDGNELEAFWEAPKELREEARRPGGNPLPRLAR